MAVKYTYELSKSEFTRTLKREGTTNTAIYLNMPISTVNYFRRKWGIPLTENTAKGRKNTPNRYRIVR